MKKLNKGKLNTQILNLIDNMGEPADTGTSKFLEYLKKRGTPIIPEITPPSPKIKPKRNFPFIR